MTARAAFWAVVVAGVLVSTAMAGPPNRSLRPVIRTDVFPIALPSLAPEASLRPHLRPRGLTTVRKLSTQTSSQTASSGRIGKICRDRDLQGTVVGHVPGKLPGCGIAKGAVKLYSVSGVRLSTPAVMECDTARAIKKWVEGGMSKAVGRYGGGVVELKVAAGYACRTRNHRPGAKISEHGKGRAIDFSGFELKNGDTIVLLKDWDNGKKGRILKAMHRSACGPFGTVLGPESDAMHKDHFHFDIAKHRGGPYCR